MKLRNDILPEYWKNDMRDLVKEEENEYYKC